MIHPADEDRLVDRHLGIIRGAGILLRWRFREVLRTAIAATWAECERTCGPSSFREGYETRAREMHLSTHADPVLAAGDNDRAASAGQTEHLKEMP